jgi:hypothetical protein
MIAFSLLGRRNASLSQILDQYPCGNSCENLHCLISRKIQGLPELADQNNTVNSSSSGNNRKNVQKNLS